MGALLTAGTAGPCGLVAPADAAGDALVTLPGLMGAVGAAAIGLPVGGYGFCVPAGERVALPSTGRAVPPEPGATVEAGLVGAVAMAGCTVALLATGTTLAGLATPFAPDPPGGVVTAVVSRAAGAAALGPAVGVWAMPFAGVVEAAAD